MKLIKHLLFISVFACVFALSGANNASATANQGYWSCSIQDILSGSGVQSLMSQYPESTTNYVVGYVTSSNSYYNNTYSLFFGHSDIEMVDNGSGVSQINNANWSVMLSLNTCNRIDLAGDPTQHLSMYGNLLNQITTVYYNGSIAPPSTDLTYQVNMSLTSAGNNFIASYSGKTTDPTSTIPDPTEVRWNVTDYDIIDQTSVIGTKLMCETMTKPITDHYTNADCTFTRITGHRYSVVMGVYLGNATQDNFDNGDQIYNIIYKMSSIELLNQSGTYSTDTTTCVNSTISGEIGFGNNCNSTIPGLQSYLDDCINVDFPYIHVVECSSALYQTIHILTFGHINFSNSFVQVPDCRQLVMLDDWMLLPDDYILCPQFPSYVRDTITPFITLFLGMITVLWLGKVKSDGGSDV